MNLFFRRDAPQTTGLERRGRSFVIYLTAVFLVSECALIILAWAVYSGVSIYDQLVYEDLGTLHEVQALQLQERSLEQYVFVHDSITESIFSEYLNEWDASLDQLLTDLRDTYADEAQALADQQIILRAYFEKNIIALRVAANSNESAQIGNVRKALFNADFNAVQDAYRSRLLQVSARITDAHYAHVENGRGYLLWIVVSLAGLAGLLLSIWYFAYRAVLSSDDRGNAAAHMAARQAALSAITPVHGPANEQMLVHMSHDIRIPMNSIMGMVSLLLDTDMSDEQREYGQSIYAASHSLLTIVEDMLILSKLEAQSLVLEEREFTLRTCMEDAMEAIAVIAVDAGLKASCLVQMDVPHRVYGDAERVRQIVINLAVELIRRCSNSKGDTISIRVQLKQETEQAVVLHVVIMSMGKTPAAEISSMLKALIVKDTDSEILLEKYGLAYGVSEQLLQRMGGTVGVFVEQGKPIFYFDVHFAKVEATSFCEQDVRLSLTGKRVLVVDAESTVRSDMCDLLREWGCLSSEALDVNGAQHLLELAQADHAAFDVLLIDLHIDATDAAAARDFVFNLKQNPALHQTACILLVPPSQHSQKQDIGLAAVITKPVPQSLLYETLVNVMQQHAVRKRKQTHFIADINFEENQKQDYTILLAEDNPVNQKLTLRLLERCGYHVIAVENGAQAIQELNVSTDLILMDCQMPIMDGFEATQTIRAKEARHERIPIIAMTANAMAGDRERCLAAGMDDYLAKPIKIEALIEVMHRWLQPRVRQEAVALERDSKRKHS